jgi:hypothetical protein
MIPVPSGVRVWLAVGRTDMRTERSAAMIAAGDKLTRRARVYDQSGRFIKAP